jgi:predicted  nucleic acid-binding Zn-ribbon protein
MLRLPLLLCAIALIGAALSAALYFQIGNSKQVLELRLADVSARAANLDRDLAASNQRNGSLQARLDTLSGELGTLRKKIAVADLRTNELERELVAAKSSLSAANEVVAVYELTARALAGEVAALRQDLSDSRASNASSEAVAAYKVTIAELERQLARARNGAVAPAAAGASTAVFTSRAGRATILTVGPQNTIVVLNFGSARGAQLGQKLTVSQGVDEVATVRISDVRTNLSVAQVLPDTLRGVLQKGDLAVLIR